MSRLALCCVLFALSSAAFAVDAPPAAPPSAPATAPVARVLQKLPVAAFAQLDFVEQASLSPDGRNVAGVFGIDGKQAIGVFNLFSEKDGIKVTGIPEKSNIRWVQWVNDDNVLFGTNTQQNIFGAFYYVSRVIAFNRVTGKAAVLIADAGGFNASDVIWTAHDGSPTILLGVEQSIYEEHDYWPKVYRVDVSTGKFFKILDGIEQVRSWYADSEGSIRAGLGYDDNNTTERLLYRSKADSVFRTRDRANVAKREEIKNPFLLRSGDDRALIYIKDAKGIQNIAEYDFSTQKLGKTIYVPESGDISDVITSRDGTTLLGVRETTGRSVHWIDPKFAELQAAFDKAVPSGYVDIVSLSADQTKMLVTVTDNDYPGVLYYYDTADGALRKIALINEAVGNKHLAPTRFVTYAARDGLEINAKLTVPAGRETKNLPIIMLPHGGPWEHESGGYDWLSQFLANRGYVVIQPDFRGSTGHGDTFERRGDGEMGRAMQDDISDGLAWAVKEGFADPKRACIFGWSYGGYAAMWGLVKDPDLYRCGISMAGVSSLKRDVNAFLDSGIGKSNKIAWQRMAPDFDAVSPINFVEKIKAPLLLIHGKQDVTVDVSQSKKMNAKMAAAGKTVEYIELPFSDHYAQRQADRVTLLSAIDAFLAKYNPADPAPTAAR